MNKYKKGTSRKLSKLFSNFSNEVDPKVVKNLLEDGANPNYISDKDNWGLSYHTFMMSFRKDEWIDSVKLLIEYGGDVNAQFDDDGKLLEVDTPLRCALRHSKYTKKIQGLLLKKGALTKQ